MAWLTLTNAQRRALRDWITAHMDRRQKAVHESELLAKGPPFLEADTIEAAIAAGLITRDAGGWLRRAG